MARPDASVPLPPFVHEALAHCFGCGPKNDQGLHLQARREGELTIVELQGQQAWAGWDTVYHGGIVATLVDEVAAFAMFEAARGFAMTRKLTVEYKRRLHWTRPVRAEARVVKREGDRILVACRLVQDGQECTAGEVEFHVMGLPPPRGA